MERASQNPFSEKSREEIGPAEGPKEAAGVEVRTSKILVVESEVPAAKRWPSGWKAAVVKAAGELVGWN